MKHTLTIYFILFCTVLTAPKGYSQLVKVIDNKGTITEVENSKWKFSSDGNSIYNAATQKSVGIGTNSIDGSALLDLKSINKGFLPPRLTSAQRDAITKPAIGLCVFNTETKAFEVNIGSVDVPLWKSIADNAVTTDKILDGTITTVDIANGAITNDKIKNISVSYSKIQNVTSNTILGRTTQGSGSVEEIATTGTLKVVLSASPILTGKPEAPTAAVATNTNQIATTSFVMANSSSDYKSVNSGEEISTTSTTDVVVPGMSINPGAGTYSVMFNSQYEIRNSSNLIRDTVSSFSIYQDGVLITNSTRIRVGDTRDVSLLAIASVAEGKSIEIRVKISSGTLALQNRILTLIKVR